LLCASFEGFLEFVCCADRDNQTAPVVTYSVFGFEVQEQGLGDAEIHAAADVCTEIGGRATGVNTSIFMSPFCCASAVTAVIVRAITTIAILKMFFIFVGLVKLNGLF
jgi:hypothetical protein